MGRLGTRTIVMRDAVRIVRLRERRRRSGQRQRSGDAEPCRPARTLRPVVPHDCSCYRPPRLSSGWERRVNYDGKRSGLLGAEITASGASRSLWLGVAAGGSRRSRRHSTGLWAQCANMPRSVIERPLRHENAADDRSFVYAFKPLRPNLIFRTHATDVFVNP